MKIIKNISAIMDMTRYCYLTLLMLFVSIATKAQQQNILSVPDITMDTGSESVLNVCIENTDAIVAAQFDLTLKAGLTLGTTPTLTERCSDHTVTVRSMGSGVYRVLLFSATNTPLSGSEGAVFTLPITADAGMVPDSEHPMTLSGVLSIASGQNVLTAVEAGIVYITEEPTLTVAPSKTDITEGESFTLTVSTNRVASYPVTVTLVSEDNTHFSLPAQTVIPAGQQTVVVNVTTIDDDLPGLDIANTFTVSAPRHHQGETVVILHDNDMPALQLTLLPSTIQEGAGPLSVGATLRRTGVTANKITVRLSDDANGALYYSTQTITMENNVDEVTFNLGPVDNALVDGDRTYTLTAAVYISSCSCSAQGESAGAVSAQLQVLDDDGPALTISSAHATLKEGQSTTLTVSRNTPTDVPLIVTLDSDYDEGLSYSHSVTIPQGERSVDVVLQSLENATPNDSHTVVFTAHADGFGTGTCWVFVTDQTLPDAVITSIAASSNEVMAGDSVQVALTLANQGIVELPELTKLSVYGSWQSAPLASLYLQSSLGAGDDVQFNSKIGLPQAIGTFTVWAVANEQHTVQELLYTNNTSTSVAIQTTSPFSVVSVQSDRLAYQPGDTVVITGTLAGTSFANQEVEVYAVNDGYRHKQLTVTDENGHFTVKYVPFSRQMGRFDIGACYPGEQTSEPMASFNVYGLRLQSSQAILCKAWLGETYNGTFTVVNPCQLTLTDVQVTAVTVPDNLEVSLTAPGSVTAGGTFDVHFSIDANAVSQPDKWQEIKVVVSTHEGAQLTTTLYYYCQNNLAQIVASVTDINLTVTKGTSRDYAFTLTNTGKGATGIIRVNIPSWMKLLTPQQMPSLASGDSATVVLQITPTDDMEYNVPVTGTIGISPENAQGLTLHYRVEAVAEETGTLRVDVCDEYTYYTPEGPHVAGAFVQVKHPYTEQLIAQGTTGADGTYSVELPEGYYKIEVSADKHEKYGNFCYVNPGKTELLTVNLSYQAITITWEVEETEVEDQYQIITTVNYETNVPAPVVKVSIPERIDGDTMAVGDAVLIDMGLTNVGLINALDVNVVVPTDMTEWKFEPLDYTEPFILAAQQSVSVPVRITRIADESVAGARTLRSVQDMPQNYANCMAGMGARYKHLCGEDLKENAAAERLAMKACALSATAQAVMDALSGVFGGGFGGPGGGDGGGGGGGGGTTDRPEITKTIDLCDTCDVQRVEVIINSALDFTWFGPVNSGLNEAIDAFQKQQDPGLKYVIKKTWSDIVDAARDFLIDHFTTDGASNVTHIVYDVYKYVNVCKNKDGGDNSPAASRTGGQDRRRAATHSWVEQFDAVANKYIEQLTIADSLIHVAFGDPIWFDEIDEGKARFMEWVNALPDEYVPTDEELLAHKPESASLDQMRAYLNHLNGFDDTLPTIETIAALMERYRQLESDARAAGYMSLTDQFASAYENYVYRYQNIKSSSVCATISLQLTQEMVMTRQAFRGILTVFNGHETDAMQDVRLNLEVKNRNTGALVTSHEFQMNAESLTGFGGEVALNEAWTLDAQTKGVATVLFIPTKYAAPAQPQYYSFGGTLTYVDPFTQLEVTRKLYPVTLTVNPTADIDLDYFMQRDIYGDDPLTADVVEPMLPAEFALIINNKGNGDARNVRMTTHQPEIVDNEKGLLINFDIISSQTNGETTNMSLNKDYANDFGTIPAHSQAYAQWWLRSTLLGHFTDYDVQVNHLTSYGNPDLSLIGEARIHELIHGFTASTQGDIPLRGFLVNEVPDAYDQPDSLFFTNATQSSVKMASSASFTKLSDTEYVLTVSPAAGGWNYGSLADPTHGEQQLASITRQSDGHELPVDNMWQTDRTLRDGEEWLYESRLHFIVDTDMPTETYLLVFTEQPAPEWLNLSEDDTTHPTDNFVGDVALKRSLRLNHWNTLCLPFNMTDDEVRACWGIGTKVAGFTDADIDTNGDPVLCFTVHHDGIQANRPCLIKPTADTLNILLYDRTVTWSPSPKITAGDYEFVGIYDADTPIPVDDYYIYNDQFYRSVGLSTMQAYRGWFHDTSASSGARRMGLMLFDDDTTTYIILPTDDGPTVPLRYDLRGIRRDTPYRGIFIEEGKKRLRGH